MRLCKKPSGRFIVCPPLKKATSEINPDLFGKHRSLTPSCRAPCSKLSSSHVRGLPGSQGKVRLHTSCSGSFCKDKAQLMAVALCAAPNTFPSWNIKELHQPFT